MPFVTNSLLTQRRKRLDDVVTRLPEPSDTQRVLTKDALKKGFEGFSGQLVCPWDPNYQADRKGNSMYPYLASPELIAYCATISDVAICLQVAREYHDNLTFSVRGGSHSNCGYSVSSGMVIDISRLDSVIVLPEQTSALVEAGANLGTVYQELERYGLHIPGGECDSVGVSGHCMGGGYGFTSRTFGLNCDVIERVWMILADGRTVVADENVNPDLFWAVRGGTGNQFGILLRIQYRLTRLPQVWAFVLAWPLEDAPRALVEIQARYIHGFS